MSRHVLGPHLTTLDAAVASAAPTLSGAQQRLAVAVYRLLAHGTPVEISAAAAAAGMPVAAAQQMINSWSGVYQDASERVIGFWGLAIAETPHHLRIGAADVYAWCAWDPMFLALIVGPMNASTQDPVTSETISYEIDVEGVVSNLSHPGSAISFLRPDEPWKEDIIDTFCNYVLQFASASSAAQWVAQHAGTFVISFDDGLELARRHARRVLGPALAAGAVSSVSWQSGIE